jgi:hypothetical protein
LVTRQNAEERKLKVNKDELERIDEEVDDLIERNNDDDFIRR